MAHAQEKLASFLKKELSVFLQRRFPHDPGVFLSIADVLVDTSSESAKIYVSIFPESRSGEALSELKLYRSEAKKYLAARLKRRKVPQIIFLPIDIENLSKLEKLLEKVKNE